MVAMMAGSDFIKTSTGKEAVNATLPVGLVMIRAIQEFYRRTGKKVSLYFSFLNFKSPHSSCGSSLKLARLD
jgi:hypothetical protein